MILPTLTSFLLLNWLRVDSLVPDLSCHVANYTVHLQIQLNTTILNNTKVMLQTRKVDIPSLEPKTYPCEMSNNRSAVMCSVWHEKDERRLIYEYFNTDYQVDIVEKISNTVLWSRVIGELNGLMYDCFENHEIEKLKIKCGDCVAKPYYETNSKGAQCRHLQWHRQKHDVNYELISKHTINIGAREVTNYVDCDHLNTLCVYHNLHNLDECNAEEVCVDTYFKPPNHGPPRPKLTRCTSTRHMCNRNKCNPDKASPHFRLIVSITLSCAGIIMLGLAGLAMHHRYKQRRMPGNSPVNDYEDDDDPIKPRSEGHSLCPYNDHNYAYPELVLSDDLSEASEYSEAESENSIL